MRASVPNDPNVNGVYARLQNAFGNGYKVVFNGAQSAAQTFKFNQDCTLATADNGLLAMVGDRTPLHYQYFFPSVMEAQATVPGIEWDLDACTLNADGTLACTAQDQSIFQFATTDYTLEIGDQVYNEAVSIVMEPVTI